MKAIIACEKNGGMGFEGGMPWPKQKKDLERFKQLTIGKRILMGRGTWQSKGFPTPLPDRTNIVVSSMDLVLPPGTARMDNISPEYIAAANIDWCIGGSKLIDGVWDQISEFHISHLHDEYECDTFIDLSKLKNDFRCVKSQLCLTHFYETWERK